MKTIFEAFGYGATAGGLTACVLEAAFWNERFVYAPIIAIAGIGTFLVVSAIIYEWRR